MVPQVGDDVLGCVVDVHGNVALLLVSHFLRRFLDGDEDIGSCGHGREGWWWIGEGVDRRGGEGSSLQFTKAMLSFL